MKVRTTTKEAETPFRFLGSAAPPVGPAVFKSFAESSHKT